MSFQSSIFYISSVVVKFKVVAVNGSLQVVSSALILFDFTDLSQQIEKVVALKQNLDECGSPSSLYWFQSAIN